MKVKHDCQSRGIGYLALGLCLCFIAPITRAQSSGSKNVVSATTLKRQFFAVVRTGDAKKFLSYIPAGGVNLGREAQHTSREEVEQQLLAHGALYCKLFDSGCINAPIDLGNSVPTCSYRELLTHSQKVRTAATETTRNGVRQAILVAEIKNDRCTNQKLIDFIFNLEAGEWKLFSIP